MASVSTAAARPRGSFVGVPALAVLQKQQQVVGLGAVGGIGGGVSMMAGGGKKTCIITGASSGEHHHYGYILTAEKATVVALCTL